jgi:hypothetical protein
MVAVLEACTHGKHRVTVCTTGDRRSKLPERRLFSQILSDSPEGIMSQEGTRVDLKAFYRLPDDRSAPARRATSTRLLRSTRNTE